MKNFLLFNQLFGTEGSPNQTGETLTRENRIGLMSYLRRTLMLLFAVLTLACGNVWGQTTWVRLDSIDFTNTTNFPAQTLTGETKTISGVYFIAKSSKNIKVNNSSAGIDFDGQNASAGSHVLAIPVTGVNEELKIIVYHDYNSASASFKTAISHADDNDPSKTQTYDLSIGNSGTKNKNDYVQTKNSLTGSNYIVWVGEAGSDYKVVKKVAIYTKAAATPTHTVTAAVNNASYGSASAASTTVAEGGTTTVTATPNTGYRFVSWAVSGTGSTLSSTSTNPTTLTMGTANTTVTATFEAIPSHTITYTNTKSMDNSANPTSYYEGVGVASFTKLRHAEGFDFTGWSPSSISSSATTNQTIEAQWTARAAAAGTGTLTYNFGYSDNTITTSSITRNNGALYDATNLTWTGVTIDGSESDARSGKITTTDDYNSGKYLSLTFKIADGYTFTPTEVQLKAVAVSHDKTIRFEFTDNAGTPNSKYLEQTRSNGSDVGTLTYDFDASDPVTLIGTVTVKIYAYGDDDSWRLGTPITITGTVAAAAACTAPTAVYVTQTAGSADMVAGESFTLSVATSTGVEEGATYQWYRNSTEVGTNLPTYTVPSCTKVDAGTYWCKITNPCGKSTTNSTGFGIKVWQVLLYKDSWNAYDLTSTGTKTGEVTRQLTPGTYYIKLTHNNGVDFGVNTGETISEITATTPSAWTLYNGQNNIKLTVTTAGDYTFGVDYTSADNPKLSVTYPPSTISSCDKIYFCPTVNSIATGSAKFSIYFYNATQNAWANCYLVDGTEFADDAKYVAYAPAPGGWTGMIVVRYSSYISSWDNKWNQSENITYNGYNYITGRNEWTSDNPAKFKTHLNSFYSSTTPAMSESEYCVIVGGTTTASTNLPSSAVTYTSSDEAKATVGSTTGVITGVAAGTATITAKVGTCTVGTATVTVYAAPSVALSASSVTYGSSAPTLTPSNFATVTGYSSSTTGTATINGSGVISIVAAGTTTFTVTGTDQCDNSVNVTTGTFTVNKANITPTLSYTSTMLTVGGGNSSNPTVSGNTGNGGVTYSSSNTSVATVNETTGVVTPVAAGSATITATIAATTNYNGNTATATFTIEAADDDCDDPQTISKVVLSKPNSSVIGTATGYNDNEYAGTPVVTADAGNSDATNIDGVSGNETGYKMGSAGNSIVFATLAKGTFRAGDVVKIGITRRSDTRQVDSKYNVLTIYYGTNKDDVAALATINTSGDTDNSAAEHEGAGIYSYTLTAADVTAIGSKKGIGLFRASSNGENPYVHSVEIYGCREWTIEEDETAPTLSSSVPADGATSVATSGNITLTFSENVTIVDASKFSLSGGTGTLNTASASASGAVVTIPYSGLANSTTYTLSTAAGAVEDAADNVNAVLDDISFTTEAAAATYTVTYNAQGGSVMPASETVSTATLPTPTKSGYAFDGWYTSGGSKITGTYNPTADITLYAQWQSTDCDAGGTTTLVDINFKDAKWSDKTFEQGNTNDEDLINGVYFWCKDETKHFSLEDNTSNGLTFPNDNMSSNNRYFCIPITGITSSNKQITVTLKHGYSNASASFKYFYNDGRTEWVDASAGSGTSVSDAQKSDTEITFTLNNSGKGLTNTAGHLFIGRNSSSYKNIYGVTVTTPGAAGTCYYVTYNGNGATGGYTTDEAAYASGDEATAATNSFTKTGYTFGGWAISKANADARTKTYDEGDAISITGNITLYAIWQAAGYTLAWNSNGGSALSGTYSSGSFADGADITAPEDPTRANYTFDSWNTAADGSGNAFTGTMPAANTTYYAVWKNTLTLNTGSQGSESDKSPTVFLDGSSLNGFSAHKAAGYTLQGYYTAATGGTKVLNADGSFAASNIARFVTSGKWSRTTGDTILVAQWESSYLLKWNLQLNKAEDAISTTSKESATARVTTASMTNLTNNGGLTITSSKKSDLTSMIETPIDLFGAESKYMSVSFNVTAGYQLLPSAVKVVVQPVGNGENKYAKLILEDENSHSISTVVTCEGTEKGKKTTVTLSNAGGTVFTGTVTLKILVYNASGESTTNNCYRLGSPIQIDGAIEAACNLPSYEGLEYDQTEYTVGVDEASAIRVTGGSADTYQWKWNSTNDRSTGTVVGTNNASYTPLITISEVGTRYYWCELKNDDCDGVVKTPVVAVTVSSAVTATTVTWSDPENEPNYGGGGYVIRATVDQTEWGGTLGESNLVAPAGIHITNVATGTDDGKQYIEATFDVTTAFDRDENEVIVFGLTHDAVTGYSAISVTDTIDYDACSGGEEGSAAIALTSAIHDEGSGNAPRYWFETSGVGRVFGINYGKATLSTSSDAAFSTEGYSYVASSTSQRWVFQPYVEGVTKIRIYIKSATNTLRVLSIGKNASWQDQSSKYSNIAVDTIIYSNGKTTGLDNNQKGYAEIQFSSALTKDNYYMFTMNSSSTYIYGVTLYSGSVGDGGNLATSLTFADPGPIAADASTANFQNIASKSGENSNTLGTITYSSNNDAATVNATTGEVSIHAKETAQVVTITATLSASGCYQGATATYTINVAADACDEPSGSIELTSGSATKCSGESVILTMKGFTSGATVEWYNGDTKVNGESGYTIVTSGSTSTLETSNAGTYSAIAKVDGGCPSGAGRTNSITISNIAVDASATKIVDKWYVKNGRLTPDIALWQLSEGATLDEVTIVRNVSGEGSLGLTSSDFVARDGIVYLSGKEPSANETGADVEYTLTLTVKDACDGEHEMTEKTITLTHQKNTDKHVLAFVVNGTAKGGFTDGITAAQTTSVGLYNAIAAQFDVLATNIYATDDEKKLKEYYSQFDILCITDYPNTQTKGANSKSYVDAIGSLIDIRPILTMEAFVSKLENWKVKGISGNPKSPTTRQYTMDLQCKDHEIFAGTKLTKVGEGDEAMYRVSMVCDTLEDYKTLDATYGGGAHAEKTDYNYGGKPALQGFTFTEDMADDLLPIGLIDDGAGNPLQVGIERQENMEARLMVLGINSYAMERLADDGERIVINALKYLMKKSYEDIADCSTAFVGGAEGHEKNWDYADNWTGNTVPMPSQKVRILAECEVSSTVHALDVLIVTDGKYNHGSDNAAGKLTIKENGALIVGGKIQAASAPAYNRPRATTPDKLLIETSSTNQAALIFDNEEAETQATVNLYSLGRKPSSYQYQYFAVPMEVVPVNPVFANETHGGTGIYTYVYSEATSGWERRKYYDDLFAFEGLGITTKSATAMKYEMTGNLASTATKEITLTHADAGLNLIGNSWMAPIQIGALAEDNTDANITQTAYIYCAGRDIVEGEATSGDTETAGQWLAVPFEAAEFETWKEAGKLSVIPAMQAFQIKVDAEATLTLDYDKVVRGSTNDLNAKLRAPGRRMAANEVTMTNIRVADSKTHTDLSLFEGDRFNEAFDNGWEAEYMNGDGRSAKLYAETEAGQMAVAAMCDYEGTVVGFAPGQETEYTFSFMGEDNGYYLNDIKLQNSVRISEGETYTFTYEEGDAANRFYISRTAINAPEVATGMENLDAAAPKVQKIIYNDKLYIIRGGRLYDATGKVVK